MGGFLEKLWGEKLEDEQFATGYYYFVDNYNTSYKGVNMEDFLDCWMQYDMLALVEVLE